MVEETFTSALIIDDGPVAPADLAGVALGGRPVALSREPRWMDKLTRSRRVLERALSAGHPVYGVSTGVGGDSARAIDAAHSHDFAYRIIRQHGCGLGPAFSAIESRAIVFTRLVSLAKGYSAVRPDLLAALCGLLNNGVMPVIPSLGSVGASGDLTPLSYLASVLAGEREAYLDGEIMPAVRALDQAGLRVHTFAPKESLAIMNGTSVMTGVGLLTLDRLNRTYDLCERATSLAAEILLGRSQAFHETIHRLKGHPGQTATAEAMRTALSGSRLIDSGKAEDRIVQDPYSIRCAPHAIGAARDAAGWATTLLARELNSVNDNPIIDPDGGETLFGGNFYGGHVALAMDLTKIAAASVADLLDRQFALLVDSRVNMGLPETLVDYGGCGLKALQITCSALTARAVQRTGSDTVLSRPTEVYNQDKVSMGLHAVQNAAEIATLLQQVLATLLVALSNAARSRDEARLSPCGRHLLEQVRAHCPVLTEDRRLDHELEALVQAMDRQAIETMP
jgi:histidine ammonia-lyase